MGMEVQAIHLYCAVSSQRDVLLLVLGGKWTVKAHYMLLLIQCLHVCLGHQCCRLTVTVNDKST